MLRSLIVSLSWLFAFSVQAAEPLVVITGTGSLGMNIKSLHFLKSTGDVVPWVTVFTKPSNKSDTQTLTLRDLVISAALKEGYQETVLRFLGQDEKPNPRIDREISCNLTIRGDMVGVGTEIRCGPPSMFSQSNGMFVVYVNHGISRDEFEMVVPIVIAKIDETYLAARRALLTK